MTPTSRPEPGSGREQLGDSSERSSDPAAVGVAGTLCEVTLQPAILAQKRCTHLQDRFRTARTIPELLPAFHPRVERSYQRLHQTARRWQALSTIPRVV